MRLQPQITFHCFSPLSCFSRSIPYTPHDLHQPLGYCKVDRVPPNASGFQRTAHNCTVRDREQFGCVIHIQATSHDDRK